MTATRCSLMSCFMVNALCLIGQVKPIYKSKQLLAFSVIYVIMQGTFNQIRM